MWQWSSQTQQLLSWSSPSRKGEKEPMEMNRRPDVVGAGKRKGVGSDRGAAPLEKVVREDLCEEVTLSEVRKHTVEHLRGGVLQAGQGVRGGWEQAACKQSIRQEAIARDQHENRGGLDQEGGGGGRFLKV